jgi:methionyl-tRNA formyltransferase
LVLDRAAATGILPRHRGADPYYWTIREGDRITGVTAHTLEEQYDTGAILAREEIVVDPRWNAWTLAKKLDRPSLRTLARVVRERRTLVPVAQDEHGVTQAPEPNEDDLELDLSMPAASVLRYILAASPFPGAYFLMDQTALAVLDARVSPETPASLLPGECGVVRGKIILRCGQGALELLRVRDDGDSAGAEWTAKDIENAAFWPRRKDS